ncbi:hypothetical protein CBW18_17970 [Pedobacter sp. AJM]|nr:hypothetical protein CBW18_17970 [Pedobacter sp. AJM]
MKNLLHNDDISWRCTGLIVLQNGVQHLLDKMLKSTKENDFQVESSLRRGTPKQSFLLRFFNGDCFSK